MSFGCLGVFPRSKIKADSSIHEETVITPDNVRLFTYHLLRSATRNFHPSTRIGSGGFGVVYKGILRDQTHVAIKCLSAESKQGTTEFLTEINMISSIHHPNLVQLLGCCIHKNNRILVYEYLENNSLASVLFGSKMLLTWRTRASICIGTAVGLAFLHEEAQPRIVHRDIKSSNILLDPHFHPKIGDFGLAKLFPDNVTHLSTRVAGTIGYLAPEYARLGQLTRKADVYSFGVLLLEIVSGQSSNNVAFGPDLMVLVEWTWKLRSEERVMEIVDPELILENSEGEVLRFIKVALFCTQAAPNQRPTMKQVVEMLSKEVTLNDMSLNEPDYHGCGGIVSNKSSSSLQITKRGIHQSSIHQPRSCFHDVSELLPRMMNKLFTGTIGITMETCIYEVLVKSIKRFDHTDDLRKTSKYTYLHQVSLSLSLSLSSAKCSFDVQSRKFLRYVVSKRGIKLMLRNATPLKEGEETSYVLKQHLTTLPPLT